MCSLTLVPPAEGAEIRNLRQEGMTFPQGCVNQSPRLARYGEKHGTCLIVLAGMGVGSEAHRREIGNMRN